MASTDNPCPLTHPAPPNPHHRPRPPHPPRPPHLPPHPPHTSHRPPRHHPLLLLPLLPPPTAHLHQPLPRHHPPIRPIPRRPTPPSLPIPHGSLVPPQRAPSHHLRPSLDLALHRPLALPPSPNQHQPPHPPLPPRPSRQRRPPPQLPPRHPRKLPRPLAAQPRTRRRPRQLRHETRPCHRHHSTAGARRGGKDVWVLLQPRYPPTHHHPRRAARDGDATRVVPCGGRAAERATAGRCVCEGEGADRDSGSEFAVVVVEAGGAGEDAGGGEEESGGGDGRGGGPGG